MKPLEWFIDLDSQIIEPWESHWPEKCASGTYHVREVLPATECAECKELTKRLREYEHETYTIKEAFALRDEAIADWESAEKANARLREELCRYRDVLEIVADSSGDCHGDNVYRAREALLAKAKGRAE